MDLFLFINIRNKGNEFCTFVWFAVHAMQKEVDPLHRSLFDLGPHRRVCTPSSF